MNRCGNGTLVCRGAYCFGDRKKYKMSSKPRIPSQFEIVSRAPVCWQSCEHPLASVLRSIESREALLKQNNWSFVVQLPDLLFHGCPLYCFTFPNSILIILSVHAHLSYIELLSRMLALHVRLGLSVGLDHPYAHLADGAAGHHGGILKETIRVWIRTYK